MMVGGDEDVVEKLRPIFEVSCSGQGQGLGTHGTERCAGHFVKMVHNGIEYGMMQAYAEGFAIFEAKEPLQSGQCADLPRSGGMGRWCARGCST